MTLSPYQVLVLLQACEGSEINLPVMLAVTLGLRRGEALGSQWQDVDLTQRAVSIRHSASFTNEGFILGATKMKNSRRTLLLPDAIITALEDALIKQEKMKESAGLGFNPYSLVCCREDGNPLTSNTLQDRSHELLAANGE